MKNKKSLTEAEICDQYITPAVYAAGWNKFTQVRREYTFTDDRGQRKRADYLLFHAPNFPVAIIEAKGNKHPVGGGMRQALVYAEILNIPFVFSSNGDGFMFHDRTEISDPTERFLRRNDFPSPTELWRRYQDSGRITLATESLIYEDVFRVNLPEVGAFEVTKIGLARLNSAKWFGATNKILEGEFLGRMQVHYVAFPFSQVGAIGVTKATLQKIDKMRDEGRQARAVEANVVEKRSKWWWPF